MREPECVDCVASMQVELSYSGRNTAREAEQGQAGQSKREREGVESGYSTQNRDERDKERQGPGEQGGGDKKEKEKVNKTEQDQIQYIEGEGCQVWRPQVMMGCTTLG